MALMNFSAMKPNVRVTIRFEAMSRADIVRATDGEYVVWRCREDESVCDYCERLSYKIVRGRDVAALGYPPAHADCRCRLDTIVQQYGEPKPVIYYYQLPYDYQTWVQEGKQSFKLIRVFV